MGDTYIQKLNRANRIKKQNIKGSGGGPFLGNVLTTNSQDETMQIAHFGGVKSIQILHPFLSRDSWIRAPPSAGTNLILAQRVDAREEIALGYSVQESRDQVQDPETSNKNTRLIDYNRNQDPFRPVFTGELDLASSGNSQIYFGRRAVMDQRAGVVQQSLDQDRLEISSKAPTHRELLHKYNSSLLGNERKFGVVTRPNKNDQGTGKSYVDLIYVKEPNANSAGVAAGTANSYAMENSYILNRDSDGEKLVDHREGHVIDDSGSTVSINNNPLRFRKQLFTSNLQIVDVACDDKGNCSLSLPDGASTGFKLAVPGGDLNLNVGSSSGSQSVGGQPGNMKFNVGGSFEMQSQGAAKMTSQGDVILSGSTVKLGGESASQPLVLGTAYQTAMQALCQAASSGNTAVNAACSAAARAIDAANTASGTSATLPIVSGNALALAVSTLCTALSAAFTAIGTASDAKGTAFSTFSSQLDTQLSQKVKTS